MIFLLARILSQRLIYELEGTLKLDPSLVEPISTSDSAGLGRHGHQNGKWQTKPELKE